MLFRINNKLNSIEPVKSSWLPKELELEDFLISTADSSVPTLDSSVFGEPLLLISQQVKTRNKKRADILALDRMGNAVIIELKREAGTLGVETQALQYLADFSKYKGKDFTARFTRDSKTLADDIRGFLGDEVKEEEINKRSRIILIARAFDATLYSMGEWLSERGVAFRCIEYVPVEIGKERFLSFSIAFDRSPESIFPLSIQGQAREPGYYWHNIGKVTDDWWGHLVKNGQIPAGFSNQPGDQGERILTGYVSGDRIIAYAGGCGAVGWGVVENPNSYRLVKLGSKDDLLGGDYLHRLNIDWKCTATGLKDGIRSDIIRNEYGIYHPISTSVSINGEKAERLIKAMNQEFQ